MYGRIKSYNLLKITAVGLLRSIGYSECFNLLAERFLIVFNLLEKCLDEFKRNYDVGLLWNAGYFKCFNLLGKCLDEIVIIFIIYNYSDYLYSTSKTFG